MSTVAPRTSRWVVGLMAGNRRTALALFAAAALATALQAQEPARGQEQVVDNPGRGDGRETNNAQGVLTDAGGIRYLNPGSPTIADADIDKYPVPRMPDGHPDLTGPWVGGGSNGDIEREGGLAQAKYAQHFVFRTARPVQQLNERAREGRAGGALRKTKCCASFAW